MSPHYGLWIVLAVVALAVVVYRLMGPSLSGPIDKALRDHDLGPLTKAIEAIRPGKQPAAFNHAIRRLWDAYERPLAAELVKELAARHDQALISQYWIQQVLRVEPEIARASFTKTFLDDHYRPEVAAGCGSVG